MAICTAGEAKRSTCGNSHVVNGYFVGVYDNMILMGTWKLILILDNYFKVAPRVIRQLMNKRGILSMASGIQAFESQC